MLLWRKRIMQCLNLPTQARVFPHRPNLVIVQRPFTVGRGFLNIAQVVRTLQVGPLPALNPIPPPPPPRAPILLERGSSPHGTRDPKP